MKRNLTRTQKLVLSVVIVVVFVALLAYFVLKLYKSFGEEKFVNQAVEISEANEKPVFKIQRVLLFSSAYAIDNTEEHSLKDLDISQYTDIAIQIDNKSYIPDLTQENTVKAVKISDIELKSSQPTGIKSLTYKNPSEFGHFSLSDAAQVYTSADTNTQCAPIDYSVVYKNDQNSDYSTPTFYTDCSNSIYLGFINRNVVSHYSLPDNNNIAFNGSLLKQANVDLNSLSTEVNFKITLTNNQNENFIYNVKINLSFDEGITTNGYSFQGKESSEGKQYNFFKDV